MAWARARAASRGWCTCSSPCLRATGSSSSFAGWASDVATLDEEDELYPWTSEDRPFPIWGWAGAAAVFVMLAEIAFWAIIRW